MLKHLQKLLLIAALCVPWATQAQLSLTVADGTQTNSYIPIYGLWTDAAQHNQMIYPADMLSEMTGGTISDLTFYASSPSSSAWGINVTIKMMEVTETTLSTHLPTTNATTVWTGTVNGNSNTWSITLDDEYTYTGGNLLIDITTTAGTYSSCSWTGITQSNASYYTYNTSGGTQSFLPKVTFDYVPGTGNICYAVRGLQVTDINPYDITIEWVDTMNSSVSYNVYYRPSNGTTWESDVTTSTTYTAYNLDAYTDYDFRVVVYCSNSDSSGARTTSARTLPSCPQPTNLVVDSTTTNEIYLSWTAGGSESEWSVTINDSNFTTTDNPLTITDLAINTAYNIQIRALCSSDDSSFITSVSTRTLAGEPISEFPYSCGFEIDVDNEIDQAVDWVLLGEGQTNYWTVGTTVNNGGSRGLYITSDGSTNTYNTSSTSHSYAYATFSITDTGEYAISYDWKSMGESNYYDWLRVFLVPASETFTAGSAMPLGSSTYNASTAQVPAGWFDLTNTTSSPYTLAQSNSWNTVAAIAHVSEAGLYNLVFMWSNDGSGGTQPPAAVDNVQIARNTCPMPVELAATYTSSDSIVVSWTPGGSETTWIVSNGITEDVVNNTSYVFDQLNANTLYNISVRAVCSDDDTSLVSLISVRTACGDINTLPFNDNFNAYASSSYPSCWTREMSGSYPYITSNYGNCIMFAGTAAAIAPFINVPINQMVVSFDLRKEGSSSGSMDFGYKVHPDSSMVVVATINPTTTAVYDHYEYDLTSDTCTMPGYLMWRQNGSTSWYYWLDNVNVEMFNPCPKPINLVCTSTMPDSVAIEWTDTTNASSWNVFIGLAGSQPNDEDAIQVSSTNFVVDTLISGVNYDVYVRTDCGDGVSNWTGPLTFSPGQVVIGTSGSSSVTMCGGIIYDDGGPTGQYSNNVDYQLTVYPSSPDSMLVFSGTAYTESSIDYLRIYEGVGIAGNLLWQTSTSSISEAIPQTIVMSGPITLHFHTDGSVIYDGFALNVSCMAAPECAAVENLAVTAGPVSAIATWTEGYYGSYSGATVEYKPDTATEWTELPLTNDTYITITGLTPNTDYNLRVTANCGGFDAAYTETNFSTISFGCLVADPLTSHNDTVTGTPTTSYNIPVNNFYNNTFSEQLYTSADLGGSGTLVSFSLNYGYSSAMTSKTNCTVYMANTSVSSLDYSNYVDPATMTLVYSGPLNCSQGWNEFQLTAPFNYSGSNLVVAVIDNSGSYNSSSYVWNCHSESGKAFSWYSDSYTYPSSSMSKTNHAFRPDMVFNFLGCVQENTCAAPVAAVVDVTTTTVDVAWAPGNTETSWNVYYRQAGAANWSAPVNVTTNNYQFTNLNSGTNYEFMVEGICDTQLLASTVNTATLCATISSLPYVEDFNSWGTGSLPNCWYNTGAYYTNSYSIISATQNMSGTTGGSIYMYSSSGTTYVSRIIAPALDTNLFQANQVQVVFGVKYTSSSYGAPRFRVGVMDNPGDLGSFVPVAYAQHSGQLNTWEVMEVPLDTYTGNGAYIAVETEYPGTYFYCYLDNFTIEPIPTCPRPDSLMAGNATSNSVDLSWHERGNASSWIIEYGPRGFQLGTGTTVVANSNPFTLTNLNPSYQGEYYVRSVCSSSDTGEYSRIACTFGTTQIPATLPYNYDFENDAEWANWQTCSNVSIDWYRGNAIANNSSNSMYISADQGATYIPYTNNAVVNAAVYRDIDFGTTQSSFTVSFDARVGGTLSASYDGLMVFLVDPSITPVASDQNITSPWGNVNDLYRIATVRLDTNWNTYTASFDTISGVKRVAFFWFNQNTGASYPALLEPAAVDNIHIEESACPRPVAVTVNNVGSTNASLSWYGPASANYEVIYRPYPNGTQNTFVQTNTNSVTLTGLESVTQYAVWVRKICGTDTSLTSDGLLFNTSLCDNATTVTNFDTTMSTTTSSYSPVGYSTYNYSYTQTIIDSAQLVGLADAGDITAMGFSTNNTTAGDYFTNITVYLTNLPDSLGDLSSSFIHPSADLPFVKVIDNADFSYTTTGMQMHGFDTTFTWDGTSRILVSVVRNHGSWSSGATFDAHTQTSGKMRYIYQDASPYDYTSVSGGYTSSAVGDIYLISCGAGCAMPTLSTVSNLSYDGATINWVSNATEFEVAVKAATDADYPTATPVSNATSFSVTGLAPATMYRYHVRAICDEAEGLISDWAEGTFTTDSLPCFEPTGLAVQATGYTTVTLGWTANGEETNWRIHVWNTAFDTTYDVNSNPATVGGLAPDVDYSAEVMALCGAVMLESGVSNTVTFHTAMCEVPTGVTVSNVTAHTAVVSWTGNAQSYRVTYGYEGFGTGNEIAAIPVTGTTTTLTGLESGETYDVYVYAVCETGIESNASTKQTFETEPEGITTADGMNVSIYPNPTTDATTIALSGVNGEVSITIVDMNGRIVKSDSMSCEGDCTKRMEVNGLAQGAYFVRINGEGLNMVKKLVVK